MRVEKLINARISKNDEFYTQLKDIENELKYYTDNFKDKTILMNADNPAYSNFWKYFKDNFSKLGLRKITSTYYNQDGKGVVTYYDGVQVYSSELKGDGDFRSDEVVKIMNESDIVVTNPPFSLFSDLINLLDKHNKKFILIGNQNALTQKVMWKLIEDNKAWLGKGFPGSVGYFHNKHYENYATAGPHIDGMIRVSGVYWYTNLELSYKREPLVLTETYNEIDYPKYDNYNAINVDRVLKIPKDYFGEMGVPITFMNKYNPTQFEIIGLDNYLEDGPKSRFMINGKVKYARIIIKKNKYKGGIIMHKYLQIVVNDENKTLTLSLPNNLPEGEVIGPYLAMSNYINDGYKWVNYKEWIGEDISISNLKNKTEKIMWERYRDDVVIIYEDFDIEFDLIEIVETWGYLPNYVLLVDDTPVKLKEVEDHNEVFGIGQYYVESKENEIAENENEYLRCVIDIKENIKSGVINSDKQLIFIPF